MSVLFPDLSPEEEDLLIDYMRKIPPSKKVKMVGEMYEAMRSQALQELRRLHPGASSEQYRRAMADILLGPDLAQKVYGPWREGEKLDSSEIDLDLIRRDVEASRIRELLAEALKSSGGPVAGTTTVRMSQRLKAAEEGGP